ncbi:saccharopine dehydrogenase [Sulfitobacter sp. D35]|uniref:saccharopine dehydrogenase n=1 Tax=Sulfitobacter sp. D35 TaxID=3083252 RepID=UPI00296F6708|nr:saccharopine dehydrogenase [Sulfitobacter sp. D35]MDW4500102.1 saccharopine dehydrogenase [Sulfitobacter sp. D35]
MSVHLWLRAEQRPNETRTPLTPDGAAALIAEGFRVSVERARTRIIPDAGYAEAGCDMVPENGWPDAPRDAVILGLKELPDDGTPLPHTHVMFGHAYKDQPAGRRLLKRFRAGGGTLIDLEYLTDDAGRRVAAFGYWAGYAGAAVALKCWTAQVRGGSCGALQSWPDAEHLRADLAAELDATGTPRPDALTIGALGRVGTGVSDLCRALDVPVIGWDMAETARGAPFPEVLDHALFFNCILAQPGTPVFVPADTGARDRRLRVIADIACDPDSDFSPIRVYDRATDWHTPALRVHDTPPLDVTAIDNLPSLLPLESSQDYAAQLLPTLARLADPDDPVLARAKKTFRDHLARL